MYLVASRVRSAGRTSGGGAATLPARLSVPQGVACRLVTGDACAAPRRALEAHVARLNIELSPRGRR